MCATERIHLACKQVIVVLGKSRSGTSAIARSLKALGVDLGQSLLPADHRNPKGFWEDADVLYGINRHVSRALGYPWMTVGTLSKAKVCEQPELKAYHRHAIHLLERRMASTDCWGFKDPRTVAILPFWQAVFETAQLDDRYVIVVRNPLEAAYSGQKFSGQDLEMELLLWLGDLVSAIHATHGKKRVVVSYQLMLQNAHLQLERMHLALALATQMDAGEVHVYADTFLDKKLRRNQCDEESLTDHPVMAVVPLCLKVYDVLMKLARDDMQFETEAFKAAWDEIKVEFDQSYPLYHYARSLQGQNHKMKNELQGIHHSFSWKITYPLRALHGALRAYRRKLKNQRLLEDLYAE